MSLGTVPSARGPVETGFHVEPVFATPVVVWHVPDAERLNDALEKAILARRPQDPGVRRSNAGGWHSDSGFFQWGGDPAQKLAREVVSLAEANTIDLRPPTERHSGWALEGWANVNERGSSNHPHCHGGCYWSAVYYVRIDGEGGELVLHDPRLPALDMYAPLLRFKHCGPEQELSIRPKAGLLILFPSWLVHSVLPFNGPGLRISVAINLSEQIAAESR